MSAKHTPGPWDLRDVHGELHLHAPDRCEYGFPLEMRIASKIGGYKVKQADGAWDKSQVAANARLIAAAPEMIAMLARLRQYVCIALDEGCSRAEDVVQDLDELIAKATGVSA